MSKEGGGIAGRGGPGKGDGRKWKRGGGPRERGWKGRRLVKVAHIVALCG